MPTIELTGDASPFVSFAESFEGLLKISETFLDFADFPSEFIRLEVNDGLAFRAGQLRVTFYPSDAFREFASAILAGEVDSLIVKD